MSYKVHIAFGFHVNCYHSYRGDTNDERGFGGDIRIIRQIISTMDRWNKKGVPVKGTWDFENGYSLEKILPEHAPDIIEGVKRRVKENGDENIIMGYNNGALSAMTEEELTCSIEWSVSNPYGSGLKDIFGTCEKIVRPQEVMFTPEQTAVYNKLGVKALCLYYSCVPFDAFRTLIPQLKDELAFNPVSYRYKEEALTILPTYSNSDVLDAGSLRWLATDLHQQQKQGIINNDVCIFINMDADSFLWEPLGLPLGLSKIPNSNGLEGLIAEVADLKFVEFSTPGNYLKNHQPLCEVQFTQDTADGNFSGYASWAEKPFNRQIWTRLERARAYGKRYEAQKAAPSFEERIQLLSTTHFGLASPVMNIHREEKALALSAEMLKKERQAIKSNKKKEAGTFTFESVNGSNVITSQVAVEKGCLKFIKDLEVRAVDLVNYGAVPMGYYEDNSIESFYFIGIFKDEKKTAEQRGNTSYEVKFFKSQIGRDSFRTSWEAKGRNNTLEVGCENIKISFNEHGTVKQVILKGREIGDSRFLESFIQYGKETFKFQVASAVRRAYGGSAEGVQLKGKIHLPNEIHEGEFTYDFFTVKGVEGILLSMKVLYPYTKEADMISTQASTLGRFSDNKWRQVAPLQINPEYNKHIKVLKRDFMDNIGEYEIDTFSKAFEANSTMDSFNNHLTAGLIGIGDEDGSLIIVNGRQILNSMAHCPMKLTLENNKQRIYANPFGTYYGKQRTYPTRSNGATMDLYNLTMPQACSMAPSYNGVEERGILGFFGIKDKEQVAEGILAIADGAVVIEVSAGPFSEYVEDNVKFRNEKNTLKKNRLKSAVSSGGNKNTGKLLSSGIKVVGNGVKSLKKAKKILR